MLSTLVGVVVGFLLSFLATWWRDSVRSKAEKRLLAGALAAELRGFLGLWQEVSAKGRCAPGEEACSDASPAPREPITRWAPAQSYSSVYDSAGSRLYLLAPHVSVEALVTCYCRVKRTLDNLKALQRTTEHVRTEEAARQRSLQRVVIEAREAANAAGHGAVCEIQKILPQLDNAAGRCS